MTTEQTWTVNAIKDAVRASGSHWFDPDTMRFFSTKVLPTVYQGPGGIYFITSEQPPHGPRMYSVRQFKPESAVINTVGEFAKMSRGNAIATARELSKLTGTQGDFGTSTEPFKPVSNLEQFIADLKAHGCEDFSDKQATSLILRARRHHALMEKLCSDERFCRQIDAEGNHPLVTECRRKIEEEADIIGAKSVIFSGDPRGCTVKLTFEDGATNDFGKEGYCVPTEL